MKTILPTALSEALLYSNYSRFTEKKDKKAAENIFNENISIIKDTKKHDIETKIFSKKLSKYKLILT